MAYKLTLLSLAVVALSTVQAQSATRNCYVGADICKTKEATSILSTGNRIQCCLNGESMQTAFHHTFGKTSEFCLCGINGPTTTVGGMTDADRLAVEARAREIQAYVRSMMSNAWGRWGNWGNWGNWMSPFNRMFNGNGMNGNNRLNNFNANNVGPNTGLNPRASSQQQMSTTPLLRQGI